MSKYNLKALRRDILVTLGYVPYSPFRARAILNALRPTGYEDLTEVSLLGHIKYLEEKGYVKTGMAKNLVTEEEVMLITITAKGDDLLRGYCSDVGVQCGP
jgi:hypothetical protein